MQDSKFFSQLTDTGIYLKFIHFQVPRNESMEAFISALEFLTKDRTELAEDEAAAWHRDLQTARKTLKTPADKWQ